MNAPDHSAATTAEQVLQLGPEGHLLGIWTPAQGAPRPLAVLMLNAGVIHRIGAHRTSVTLSRALAARGVGCARFDMSGVGDSRAPKGASDFRAQAIQDIRTVMDALERQQGIHDFALVGICSGAARSQSAALLDPRVRGIFLIDGWVYPTWKGRWHFARRMRAAYGWSVFGQRLIRFVRGRLKPVEGPPVPDPTMVDEGPQVDRAQFASEMRELTARDVQVALLFTGSRLQHYAYEGQLRDTFAGEPWLSRVACLFDADIDHTLTLRASQDTLREYVLGWVDTVLARLPR